MVRCAKQQRRHVYNNLVEVKRRAAAHKKMIINEKEGLHNAGALL